MSGYFGLFRETAACFNMQRKSYNKIAADLEAVRLDISTTVSLLNLAGSISGNADCTNPGNFQRDANFSELNTKLPHVGLYCTMKQHPSIHSFGVGILNQFPPFCYYPDFSPLPKHGVIIKYHVLIWQVSLHLITNKTRQIWKWFKEQVFLQNKNIS